MIRGENIEFLNQLAKSLESAESKLEQAYRSSNYDQFNKIKKFILEIQKKILEVIE